MVAIGLLKERYSRVARYYEIAYDEHRRPQFSCREEEQRKQRAEALDGSYLLKTLAPSVQHLLQTLGGPPLRSLGAASSSSNAVLF
jgi:hypothetical protein